MRQEKVRLSDNLHIAYRIQAGGAHARDLLCLHGTNRNSRDFEPLAQTLNAKWRIVAPDLSGRGESDWLPDGRQYSLELHANMMCGLCESLAIVDPIVIGTSMGSNVALLMKDMGFSISGLICNDIPPFVPGKLLFSMARVFSQLPKTYATKADAVNQATVMSQDIGLQGRLLESYVESILRQNEAGEWMMDHDPNIMANYFVEHVPDRNLWHVWETLDVPILVLHGKDSRILTLQDLQKMQTLQPQMDVVHFDHIAHAPSLYRQEELNVVQAWLEKQ